jgi:hypothetical protein|tara:strand:+ start:866 stop:1294 length:429 start_codon:yes stop_codon:yes gene_type:complete
MNKNTEIKPDWRVIKIDEKGFWRGELAKSIDEMFGVYLYDENLNTYICSLTPSVELMFLGHDYGLVEGLSDEMAEQIHEAVLCTPVDEPVTYMDRRTVERLVAANPDRCAKATEFVDLSECETLNEIHDEARECFHTGSLSF